MGDFVPRPLPGLYPFTTVRTSVPARIPSSLLKSQILPRLLIIYNYSYNYNYNH